MAGNIFGGMRDISHYAADLTSLSQVDVSLGKTVRLDRAHVAGISVASGGATAAVGAFLVNAGDGTAQTIRFVRYGVSGPFTMRASVVEYY